jgi:glycosyltransferase involved in cell wall biosynthesis
MVCGDVNSRRPLISIIIPTYNEEYRIPRLLNRLRILINDLGPSRFEIIVVDGGSEDRTLEVVDSFRNRLPIKAIEIGRRGKGLALKEGIAASRGELLLFLDADDSIHPLSIKEILRKAYEGDVVIGSRYSLGSKVIRHGPFIHGIFSRVFHLLLRFMFGIRLKDVQCGLKVIRSSIAKNLIRDSKSMYFAFDAELLILAKRKGLKIVSIPVTWAYQPGSKVRITHRIRMIIDLFGIFLLQKVFS